MKAALVGLVFAANMSIAGETSLKDTTVYPPAVSAPTERTVHLTSSIVGQIENVLFPEQKH